MTIKELEAQTGGLSTPSKMPCHSYSFPASACRIGGILKKVRSED